MDELDKILQALQTASEPSADVHASSLLSVPRSNAENSLLRRRSSSRRSSIAGKRSSTSSKPHLRSTTQAYSFESAVSELANFSLPPTTTKGISPSKQNNSSRTSSFSSNIKQDSATQFFYEEDNDGEILRAEALITGSKNKQPLSPPATHGKLAINTLHSTAIGGAPRSAGPLSSPVSGRPKKIYDCAVCSLPITSNGSAYSGKYYHKEHFICSESTCQRQLNGVLVLEMSGKLYCERDYHKNFSPQCAYCKEPIKSDVINAIGKSFHLDHFFCCHCGKGFGVTDQFMVHDDKVYCEEDYDALFNTRCAGCHEVLRGNYIGALDRSWHPDCFVCTDSKCRKNLTQSVYYEKSNLPFCEQHYYALEQNLCASCQKPIVGKCILAMDKKWHPGHFCCSYCKKSLDGVDATQSSLSAHATGTTQLGWQDRRGKAYCNGCILKLF